MNKAIVLNDISFEKVEKVIDSFENKYSFDTNHFVDYIYYNVKEKVLGKQPMKYTIILNKNEENYKVILTNNESVYKEAYSKNFKRYMED